LILSEKKSYQSDKEDLKKPNNTTKLKMVNSDDEEARMIKINK
jgi:hypothetical protein